MYSQREACPDLAVNSLLVLSKVEIVISLPSRRASMSASRIGSVTLILNGSILRCLARKMIPFAHVIDLDDDEPVTLFLLKIHNCSIYLYDLMRCIHSEFQFKSLQGCTLWCTPGSVTMRRKYYVLLPSAGSNTTFAPHNQGTQSAP